MTKQTNAEIFSTFQKSVNTLISERKEWQSTVYEDANSALYALLSRIYELYDGMKTEQAADAEKRQWMYAEYKKLVKKAQKKPSVIQMLTRIVFSDTQADSRRINSYARVLTAASQSDSVVSAADVSAFIRNNGGIEEVRLSLTKNSLSPKVRAKEGRSIALDTKSLANVSISAITESAASLKGSFVSLIGYVTARGIIEVKHFCVEKEKAVDMIISKTAINSGLSNLYSNTVKKTRDKSAQMQAESSTKKKTNVVMNADASVFDQHKLAA